MSVGRVRVQFQSALELPLCCAPIPQTGVSIGHGCVGFRQRIVDSYRLLRRDQGFGRCFAG